MQPYAATIWKKSVAPDFPAYVPSIFEFTTSPNKRREISMTHYKAAKSRHDSNDAKH
jgi:hypothetical protein